MRNEFRGGQVEVIYGPTRSIGVDQISQLVPHSPAASLGHLQGVINIYI